MADLQIYHQLRSLRLLHPELSRFIFPQAASKEEAWLSRALLESSRSDEALPRDEFKCQELTAQFLREEPDALDGLLKLAAQVVVFHAGLPRCSDQDLWRRVSFNLDVDLILAAKLSSQRLPRRRVLFRDLSWPSVLAVPNFLEDSGLRQPLSDNHVHLGGALPASFYWVGLMNGFSPLRSLSDWDENRDLWDRGMLVAIRIRESLFTYLTGLVANNIPFCSPIREHHLLPPEPFSDYILRFLAPQASVRAHLNPILGERFLLWLGLCCFTGGGPIIQPFRSSSNDNLAKDDWVKARAEFLEYIQRRNSFIRHLTHQFGNVGLTHFRHVFDRAKSSGKPDGAGLGPRSDRQKRQRRRLLELERFRMRHALRYQFSDPTDIPWARDHGSNLDDGPGFWEPWSQELGLSNPGSPASAVTSPLLQEPHLRPWGAEHTPWRPARQVELRITPDFGKGQLFQLQAYLRGLRDFVAFERDAPLLRVGFVFHIVRPFRANGSQDGAELLEGLLRLLEDHPILRVFVVGLDLAGAEMRSTKPGPEKMIGVRPFRRFMGLKPVYRESNPRDLPQRRRVDGKHQIPHPTHWDDELGRRQALAIGSYPLRLGRTAHAGEDFADLLTGLRAIDDSIRLLQFKSGDRIGHGLALAILPSEFRARHKVLLKSRRDHAIDLIWAMMLAHADTDAKLGHDQQLLDLAKYRLTNFIAAHDPDWECPPYLLERVIQQYALFEEDLDLLRALNIANKVYTPDGWIECPFDDNHLLLLEAVRARVLQRVNAREIVLEICPTSNFLIGGFKRYAELPYLNLNRYGLKDENQIPDPVLLCINSDDPGTFRTTIGNEYRLMAEALRQRGYRAAEVNRWLDEIREIGLSASFIPSWSPPTKIELLSTIAKFEHSTRDQPMSSFQEPG